MSIKSFKPKVQSNMTAVKAQESLPQPSTQPSFKKFIPSGKIFGGQQGDPHDVVRILSLGGVGNVQRNMFVYEYKQDIIIIDCGIGFPEEDMPGVDLVLPDISYLKDKKSRIKGIIISHGHDDHIGGLPYIWPDLDVPIYTQKLTAGFIRNKFIEHKLPKDKIFVLGIDDTIKLGAFEASFYQVAHSVPDSTGIILKTPIGTLIHQSDFKFDWTPVNGQVTEVGKIAQAGKEGVLFMAMDSLNVEKNGYTRSEKGIQAEFEKYERQTKGKFLITTTSSNLTRIQQAINVAAASGRKVALSGRSMENNFQVGRDLGYLDVPNGIIIPQEEVKRFPDEKLMIIIAGSQGQPGSSLSRAANFDHKYIQLKKNDTVIFSANPIPGSEVDQYALVDALVLVGCTVHISAIESELHVSGHASKDEIKMMINLAKPKYLLPIGGNFRNMKAFQDTAVGMDYRPEDVVQWRQGDVIEVGRAGIRLLGHQIDLSNIYVDGLGIGDVGSIVLRDRQVMSEEGIVMVMIPFNKQQNVLAGQPEIISRGFVYEESAEDLLDAGLEIVKSIITDHTKPGTQAWDWKYLRTQIETNLEKFFYQETNRRPLILPVIVNL